jgi:hypothetical protein
MVQQSTKQMNTKLEALATNQVTTGDNTAQSCINRKYERYVYLSRRLTSCVKGGTARSQGGGVREVKACCVNHG